MSYKPPLSLDDIRRTIIVALVSDDDLADNLVLKGGNALALIHKIGTRTSVDLDFSLGGDFATEPAQRIQTALSKEFARKGLAVIDFSYAPKPSKLRPELPASWGGYLVTFKLVLREDYDRLGNTEALRKIAIGTTVQTHSPKRTFKIDISKHEYVAPRAEVELDGLPLFVYTPEMIAAEKLRAICQQMDGYPPIGPMRRKARARDFYDIHTIVTECSLDLSSPDNRDLVRAVFEAKDVPLSFLARIQDEETFDLHAPDWPAVATSARPSEDFKFHFDFVVALVAKLEALWKEDPPA